MTHSYVCHGFTDNGITDMQKILDRILKKYEAADLAIQMKARIVFIICLVILGIIPILILYSASAHLINPDFGYRLYLPIILPLVFVFFLVLGILVLLIRGYFVASVHLILLILFMAVWTVMFFDRSSAITRLDTVAFVIGIMTLTPMVIIRRPYTILLYGAGNILLLFFYCFYFRDQLQIPDHAVIDYLADNSVAISFVSISAIFIYNINQRALERARRDLAERKHAEDRLTVSLKEKEVLLKEIHHRVKNNFQIITSLLNLQSRNIADPEMIKQFDDSTNRIRAMALVHEKLYQSSDLSRIDFASYIKTIAEDLYSSYATILERPELVIKTEEVQLPIDQAIPCGLIVNELITNALKYAFPAGSTGNRLSITLQRNQGGVIDIRIGDNGIGLPAGIDIEKTLSLGLQLVGLLIKQVHGTYRLDREGGTEWVISFPAAAPADQARRT
jgi:two-component sensor histidine kinase